MTMYPSDEENMLQAIATACTAHIITNAKLPAETTTEQANDWLYETAPSVEIDGCDACPFEKDCPLNDEADQPCDHPSVDGDICGCCGAVVTQ